MVTSCHKVRANTLGTMEKGTSQKKLESILCIKVRWNESGRGWIVEMMDFATKFVSLCINLTPGTQQNVSFVIHSSHIMMKMGRALYVNSVSNLFGMQTFIIISTKKVAIPTLPKVTLYFVSYLLFVRAVTFFEYQCLSFGNVWRNGTSYFLCI